LRASARAVSSTMDGPTSRSTSATMPIEATPLATVTTRNVVTWRRSEPDAHRRMIRNWGTAPAVNAIVVASTTGVSAPNENPSSTTWVIVVAIAEAAVYRVRLRRSRRGRPRFMMTMPPYRDGRGQLLKPFSAATEW
jgi:hypothetical protein